MHHFNISSVTTTNECQCRSPPPSLLAATCMRYRTQSPVVTATIPAYFISTVYTWVSPLGVCACPNDDRHQTTNLSTPVFQMVGGILLWPRLIRKSQVPANAGRATIRLEVHANTSKQIHTYEVLALLLD